MNDSPFYFSALLIVFKLMLFFFFFKWNLKTQVDTIHPPTQIKKKFLTLCLVRDFITPYKIYKVYLWSLELKIRELILLLEKEGFKINALSGYFVVLLTTRFCYPDVNKEMLEKEGFNRLSNIYNKIQLIIIVFQFSFTSWC